MLILTFEEFNNKFNIDNIAMSDIRIKDIGKDISLTPIEIVMRDETPDNICEAGSLINEPNVNIIVNLHPTDGTHWVLVIRREGGPVYYFDSFGVETPQLFLEEYVDLGSNERIQQYDESYCGDYCLYMIYFIDRVFRIKRALNILVNQCKYPGIYNECLCLGCNVNVNVNDNVFDNDNVNVNDNDNVIDNDNDNVNVNDNVIVNDNVNDNDNVKDKDNVNENVNDKDNDNVNDNDNQGTCFADDKDKDNDDKDNFIYQGTCLADLFDEKHGETWQAKPHGEAWIKSHQKGEPNNNTPTNNISVNININEYNNISVYINLQSWLNDDVIITEATFPDNFRCIISGPSECGKTSY